MAALPRAPAPRRLAAWLYTGPLGHLGSMVADIAMLWSRWAAAAVRERARDYSKR